MTDINVRNLLSALERWTCIRKAIGKLMGCRTIGIAGGNVKCRMCLDEFGYDGVIDYKASTDIADELHPRMA